MTNGMCQIGKITKLLCSTLLGIGLVVLSSTSVMAGGGLVLEGDVCIIRIDFYSAHFTAYQPVNSGNQQFCEELPETGETIIVLDYLHQSLKEVPVSFRIIHDVTGQGRYVKLKHVEAIEDIERHTVFYQAPVVRSDASLKLEFDIANKGSYVGIVTAGHPTSDAIYTAVFPFEVGATDYGYLFPVSLFLALVGFFLWRRYKPVEKPADQQEQPR